MARVTLLTTSLPAGSGLLPQLSPGPITGGGFHEAIVSLVLPLGEFPYLCIA